MHVLPWKRDSSTFGAALTLFSGSLLLFVGCSQQATPPPPATKTVDVSNSSPGSSEQLYLAKKDNLFGYVNSSGKFVIRPQFTEALSFDGDRAAVKLGGQPDPYVRSDDLIGNEDGERIGFIDRSGRFAISPRFHCANRFDTGQYAVVAKELRVPKAPPQCASKANAKEPVCQASSATSKLKICSGWTIIDRSGNEILPQTYENLGYQGGDLVAAATVDSQDVERWGYIDFSGKWVVAPEYEIAGPMHEGRALVVKNRSVSITDATGRIVGTRSLQGPGVESNFSEGVAIGFSVIDRERPTQYGYVDLAGAFVIQPQFDAARSFSEGLAPVSIAGLWGFISHDGQFAINPSFKWASSFRHAHAAVCTNEGKLAFIDRAGQLLAGAPRPCPIGILNQEMFDSAFRDGMFTHDYSDGDWEGKSLGWTIVYTNVRVIYQEKNATVTSVANGPTQRDDERRVITGTAFVVSDSGYLLTNAHVVHGCTEVELPSAKTFAKVVNSDPSNDLALLHASSLGIRYASIGSAENLILGTEVIIFGFPLSGVVASSGNLTTGVVSAVTGLGDDSRFFKFTAPIQPGTSGGPVLNEYGEVIGVASAMLDQRKAFAATGTIPQNVNFAIGPSMIRQFLSANGVPAATLTTWWRFKQGTQKLAQSAEAFTYSVKCEPKETSEERKTE